jgi:hypothetical protein
MKLGNDNLLTLPSLRRIWRRSGSGSKFVRIDTNHWKGHSLWSLWPFAAGSGPFAAGPFWGDIVSPYSGGGELKPANALFESVIFRKRVDLI